MAALVAALVPTTIGSAADIGANDETGKYAADAGAVVFGQMAEMGLKQSVLTVRFLPSDPTAIADLVSLDGAIPVAQLAGLRVTLAVYPYPPSLLEDGTATPKAFAQWLTLLATRYPSVKQYVVMNEPNQPAFVRPQFRRDGRNASAAIAGRYLAAGYDALKAVNPMIRVVGLGLSPRGNDRPDAASNVSTSPVRFLAALGAWYRRSGRTLPLMDGLSFHPYPNQATDPLDRGYPWPNAGFANVDRIKQALWDAFRETPQPTTVNGLKISLDEVGWQVDTTLETGYSGTENVNVTSEATQAAIYGEIVRRANCDPHVAEVNIFGFYDDRPRGTGFQSALRRVDGTPRAASATVEAAIAAGGGCAGLPTSWYPARRVVGAVAPAWRVEGRRVIRFEAAASEGAAVVSCLLPGRLGALAAAKAMKTRTATSPGCAGATIGAGPMRPAPFALIRVGRLTPATVAVRLVAGASSKRVSTFSRTLR